MKEIFKNKSIENIKIAEIAFDNECFNASANRAYYAVFHAAVAALFAIGLNPRIDHVAVQTMFSDNFFNRRKIISSKYKGDLKELQEVRGKADYHEGVSKNIAKKQLLKAKELIEIILMELK
ncbi:MAG: HEPN domain-containing protein [Candidatus Kapabacteria bacterium]|nr:HEPN domain-containing protein [Candidatus Kapabacteria bacterium]